MTPSTEVAPAPASDVTANRSQLDRALTRGVAWVGLTKWSTQVVSWVSTIVVVGLLSPSDYGIVGMATVVLGAMTVLGAFGLDAAVIALRDLAPGVLRQLNTVAALLGVTSALVGAALAPVLAWFFRTPELIPVAIAMSTTFLFAGLRVIPQALLQRDLRFRGLALAEAGQAILVAILIPLLAWLGFRYWALVIGSVVGSMTLTGFVLLQTRCGFAWPSRSEVGGALRFSRDTITGRLAWYGYDNADFLVAGRMLGKEALGAYTVGWQLATGIIERITTLIGRVTPGVLSAAQNDLPALRRYLFAVTETVLLITLPCTIGLSLVAPKLLPLVAGDKWIAAVLPLQLLCLVAAVRSVTPLLSQVLMVTGEQRRVMRISLGGLVVLPVAFLFASQWGTAGIAAAWIVVHPLVIAAPTAVATFRRIEVRPADYFQSLAPAVTASAVMALCVVLGRLIQPETFSTALSLAADIVTGVVAYAVALLLLHRERVSRIWRFARANVMA